MFSNEKEAYSRMWVQANKEGVNLNNLQLSVMKMYLCYLNI